MNRNKSNIIYGQVKRTAVTVQVEILKLSCSTEPGECAVLIASPHIIGLPFPTVTRRSTTLMLFDDTLIRMTVRSCYIGIVSSPWSHWMLALFPVRKETVMNLMQCQLLTSPIRPGRQERTCYFFVCISDNSVISCVFVWVILVMNVVPGLIVNSRCLDQDSIHWL